MGSSDRLDRGASGSRQGRLRFAHRAWALLGLLLIAVLCAEERGELAVATAQFPVEHDLAEVQRAEANWQPQSAGAMHLPGAERARNWLRIGPLPAGAGQERVLELDRVAFDELSVFVPDGGGGYRELRDSFFDPAEGEALRSSFAFVLPAGMAPDAELWVAAKHGASVRFGLRVSDQREQLIAARTASNLASGAYASILSVGLIGLALGLALRERVYRRFASLSFTLLLFLLLLNGHGFELPLVASLGGLGMSAVLAAGLATAAVGLAFAQSLLELERHAAGWARRLDIGMLAFLLVAVLTLLIPAAARSAWVAIGSALLLLLLLAPIALTAWAFSVGSRLAALLGGLWTVFALGLSLRILVAAGWLVPGFWSLHGYQLIVALGFLLLSILLTDRVIELRRQRDRVSELHQESAASLQIEQQRRRFADALRDLARTTTAAGDLEWRCFRLLLQAVGELVPARNITLTATGFRGFDYLLTEPISAKARICGLLQERAGTLKGICRSHTPVQLPLEIPGTTGRDGAAQAQFAIVPMAVPRPGWGAVLLERDVGREFEPSELALVAELVALAVQAAEEGAQKNELRRSAEMDPLTSALNRRAGELRLDALMHATRTAKQPLSVALVDIDRFRAVNERHGHQTGDVCLRAVADAVRTLLKGDEALVRYGGEEFLLILPGHNHEQARELAERVRSQIAALRIQADSALIKLTASIGVAGRLPSEDHPPHLLERAERAVGVAKGAGRNQVQLAGAYTGEGEAKGLPPVL